MKPIIFIFLFFSGFCFSQNHVIVDSITKEPIPYANIKLLKTDKGFYSNRFGVFQFDEHLSDSIQISCLGYNSIVRRMNQLKDTIFLESKVQGLDEIVLFKNPPAIKNIGFKKSNSAFHTGSHLQLGLLVKPILEHENSVIQKIIIPIRKSNLGEKKRNFESVIKVTLFSNKNDLPYNSLLETPIIVNCNQDSSKNISIDILKEDIEFNSNGLFICLEIVGEINTTGDVIHKKTPLPGIIYTNKVSKDFSFYKSFYKTKFSNEWEYMDPNTFLFKKEMLMAVQLELAIYKD